MLQFGAAIAGRPVPAGPANSRATSRHVPPPPFQSQRTGADPSMCPRTTPRVMTPVLLLLVAGAGSAGFSLCGRSLCLSHADHMCRWMAGHVPSRAAAESHAHPICVTSANSRRHRTGDQRTFHRQAARRILPSHWANLCLCGPVARLQRRNGFPAHGEGPDRNASPRHRQRGR